MSFNNNNITYDFTLKNYVFHELKNLFKKKEDWYVNENNNTIEFIKKYFELDNFKVNIYGNNIELNIPLNNCSYYKKFNKNEANKMLELVKYHI